MTKLKLREYVQFLVGNRKATSGLTINDAWYDDRVLNGYRYVLNGQSPTKGPDRKPVRKRLHRFPSMETRLMRTLDTSLTSNFVPNQATALEVLDIYDRTNNKGLRNPPEKSLSSRDPDETGVPLEWAAGSNAGVRGYFIWPYPGVAAEAIDIYETVILTPVLATDTTSPNLDPEWHSAIGLMGGWEAAVLLGMPEKADELAASYENYIAGITTYAERRSFTGRSGARDNIGVGSAFGGAR